MRVLIVGAGIGGLALAGFFENTGIDYLIVERDKKFRHGYSLGMWSNGRAVLKKLGLGDKFDKSVIPYHELVIRDNRSRELKRYNLKKFYIDYGLGYCHLHRADLHSWLKTRADTKKIIMGSTFESVELENFDLIVGADGVHSKIRERYFGPHTEKYVNWRCWYVKPKNRITNPYTVTEYLGGGMAINLFDEGNESLAVLCVKTDHGIFDSEAGRVNRLRKTFQDIEISEEVLAELSDNEIMPTDLAEVNLNKWYKGNVVLIGDAAHAFSPFAGLGASMALEDAYILGAKLAQISSTFPIHQALDEYQRERKSRVEKAHKLTNKMRAWATIHNLVLRKTINSLVSFIPEGYYVNDYISLMQKQL